MDYGSEDQIDYEYHRLYIKEACPKCGNNPVLVLFACHTWPGRDGKWMSCIGCDSAGDIFCPNDNCDWAGYKWGLNPRNPRAESNEKYRPAWLVGDWPY